MCDQHSRRDFLGLLGRAGILLALPGQLFLREAFGVESKNALYDAVIQVFYEGGPSQTDTWDPKPGSRNNVFGTIGLGANDIYGQPIRIAEHFPGIASLVSSGDPAFGLGIVRSVTHGSGDHGTAQEYMNCFWGSPIAPRYPSTLAVMSHYFQGRTGELGVGAVRIAGGNGNAANDSKAASIGTALDVNGDGRDAVELLSRPAGVDAARYDRRRRITEKVNERLAGRPDEVVRSWQQAWREALDITNKGKAAGAFDLTGKPLLRGSPTSDRRIVTRMTLAQELVKAGVPYVALGIGGNDSHDNNRAAVASRWGANTDPLVSEMARNLKATGKRVLVCMGGEFGRTPNTVADGRDGRDHWANGFSWAFVSVNQPLFKTTAVGDTGPDGMFRVKANEFGILKDPVLPGTLGAFVYKALGFQVGTDPAFDVPTQFGLVPPVDRAMAAVEAPKLMGQFGLA